MKHFKDYQLHAYRESFKLIILLSIAIISTILLSGVVATYVVAVQAFIEQPDVHNPRWFYGLIFLICTSVAFGIVACGTLWKLVELRAGGAAIAESLGGQLLSDPKCVEDQRVINVVQEMAIASATPIPAIYVLESERAINAFAAGYSKDEAVIGITRGAIDCLSRDQLQGIVAHEFSHIINGDMRLNMHMLAWLHGILSITLTAEWLIKDGYESLSEQSDGFGKRSIRLGNCVLGFFLWPVGMIGWFASLLVKAAMNRQREFLADAFAVEFTRHPQALADALKFLISHDRGTRINCGKATELSHMFFLEGSGWLNGMLASHPPLNQRIKRLDPNWDGLPLFQSDDEVDTDTSALSTTECPAFHQKIIETIPPEVLELFNVDGGAQLILQALLSVKSIGSVVDNQSLDCPQYVAALIPFMRELTTAQHLVLFDSLIDWIKQNPEHRQEVLSATKVWQQVEPENLFVWMVREVIVGLDPNKESIRPHYGKIQDVLAAYLVILSWISHASGSDAMAAYSFQRGLASTGLDLEMLAEDQLTWEIFIESVDLCTLLAPQPRHDLLASAAAAVSSDRQMSDDETLLMRTLCAKLIGTTPPFLPGQPLPPG